MVDVGPADKVPFPALGHVQALNIVRIPVQRGKVDPGFLGHPPADWGDYIGLDNGLFGLKPEPLHLAFANSDILVSSRIIATARDPAEGDIFTFEFGNVLR